MRVLTVYPTATETPMMATSGMGRDGGRETPSDVAREIIEAMAQDRLEVVRGGPARLKMVKRNRIDPGAVDEALRAIKPAMEDGARDHSALCGRAGRCFASRWTNPFGGRPQDRVVVFDFKAALEAAMAEKLAEVDRDDRDQPLLAVLDADGRSPDRGDRRRHRQ